MAADDFRQVRNLIEQNVKVLLLRFSAAEQGGGSTEAPSS